MGQALPVERSRSQKLISASGSRFRKTHSQFVLFDELPKDVLVYSLRFLPSQDHCKLARTNRIFADGSRAARLLYKGLRINSLRSAQPGVHMRRSSVLTTIARRALTAVLSRARAHSAPVGGSATGGYVPMNNHNSGGGVDAGNGGLLPLLRLFRRGSNENSSASQAYGSRSLSGGPGGSTRAAIRALSSGAFKNLRMLSFPNDFDAHAYDLSYHELASIFTGCPSLKLVSSLPGGVLSFIAAPLPTLREISVISGTPSDLHAIFRHAPELTWLSFSPILSSACEPLLCQIPEALPHLKTLELICIRLSRHVVLRDMRKLESLEMLSLQQVGIDDVDLQTLSEDGHPSLKVLVILGNPQVSYTGLRSLHDRLEELKVLDVRDSLNHF